jgi:arylsulfatase A-like enzyme
MEMDLLPTIADLAGVTQLPAGVEGTSLKPTFTRDEAPRDVMYWRMNERWSVRRGPWKLLVNPRDDSKSYPLDPVADKVFLSNLEMDISESRNLAKEHPDKVRELIAQYRMWQHFKESDFAELPAEWR